MATNDPDSGNVGKALARKANLKVATTKLAVTDSEVVFRATPFQAKEAARKAVADDTREIFSLSLIPGR